MEQYETKVEAVMDFLAANDFSQSVVYSHRKCYKELKDYLLQYNTFYSRECAQTWLDSCKEHWSDSKYKDWCHCVDQLDDVYKTGSISPDHLACRKAPYQQLNDYFKDIVDGYLGGLLYNKYTHRVSTARFLLYLQNKGIGSITEIDYDILFCFYRDDYHTSSKTKDIYSESIRKFLKHLAQKGLCPLGLSLAMDKTLIHQIVTLSEEELRIQSDEAFPGIDWNTITIFLSQIADLGYSKTIRNASKHILKLLYIFQDMQSVALNEELLWRWFNKVKPLVGKSWKQHRRTLYQFVLFLQHGNITTAVTGNPEKTDALDQLPEWASLPLKNYLNLLRREGRQPSTVAMQRSSNLRLCRYLISSRISDYSEVTPELLEKFNLQDNHLAPEGKAAYNCRIRSFLIYLYEQKYIEDPYLFKALPTFSAPRTSLVETLSKDEVADIWRIDTDSLSPKEYRDYAMVCIGLTIGFRASDIVSLRFENVNWKQKSISIIQQKTRKALTMPMPVKTGNILFKYIKECRPKSKSPFIFIRHEAPYDKIQRGVCGNALKRFISSSPDKKVKFHSVRKTFATQLLASNTNVELISDSLGHSTDDTVHKYLSLDEQRMRLCPISLAEAGISFEGGVFRA